MPSGGWLGSENKTGGKIGGAGTRFVDNGTSLIASVDFERNGHQN